MKGHTRPAYLLMTFTPDMEELCGNQLQSQMKLKALTGDLIMNMCSGLHIQPWEWCE